MSSGTLGRVGVIGGGVMGQALVGAMLEAGVEVEDLEVCEPAASRAMEVSGRYGVRAADSARKVARGCDVLVLAVKPGDLDTVLAEVRDALSDGAVVVSVAAGVPCAFYERRLNPGTPVVRVMPNTPALVGQGASAVSAGTHAGPEHVERVRALLARTGLVLTVPEKQLDAVTAVSGSGPAYVFYLLDALTEAGVLLGLPRDQSMELATATFRGAVALQEETGEHPVVLRERVSSPGGTTVAAIRQLDAHGVRAGIVAAAEAARDRSRELAAEQD